MDRLQHQHPLEHGGQLGIQHADLCTRKLLHQQRPGIPGGLERPAEGGVQADAQHRLPPLYHRAQDRQIVLHRGHGGPGKDAGPVGHLLIKFPVGDVLLLPVIILPVKGDIEGNQRHPQLLRPLPSQVAGAVAHDLKSFHVGSLLTRRGPAAATAPGPAHILFCCYRE